MIAAVKKVAKKCNGSCLSLSCEKMEAHVHALGKVLGFFSGVGAAFLGLCALVWKREQGGQGVFPSCP